MYYFADFKWTLQVTIPTVNVSGGAIQLSQFRPILSHTLLVFIFTLIPCIGKILSYHFDKFCAIPCRPGEFFFLLGVSKSLLYSGLPGHCGGELAGACRSDSHLFHHGCPVFEVHTHTCRITSLAVSSAGNFVATGDEHGVVNLSYIFPFKADLFLRRNGWRVSTLHRLASAGKPKF